MAEALASSDPAVAAWRHWYKWCAASRCTPTEQDFLRGFVAHRCRRWAQKLGWEAAGLRLPPAEELWHRFEMHLMVESPRVRRVLKYWLYARARGQSGGAWLATIEAGATLVLRDVLRRWYREELPPPNHVSLDAPLSDYPDLRLQDLLPSSADTEDAVATREVEEWAQRFARRHFRRASRAARAGLLLRGLERPLYGRQAERLAGCGQTKLYREFQGFVRDLAADVQRRLGSEDHSMALHVALRAVALARDMAVRWGHAEKSLRRVFVLGGGARRKSRRRVDS